MKVREPISHWNNFSVTELKDILEHCIALESLGVAQDEEMMVSIERDIALREKKTSGYYESRLTKTKRQVSKDQSQRNRILSKTTHPAKQESVSYLLEENAQ